MVVDTISVTRAAPGDLAVVVFKKDPGLNVLKETVASTRTTPEVIGLTKLIFAVTKRFGSLNVRTTGRVLIPLAAFCTNMLVPGEIDREVG